MCHTLLVYLLLTSYVYCNRWNETKARISLFPVLLYPAKAKRKIIECSSDSSLLSLRNRQLKLSKNINLLYINLQFLQIFLTFCFDFFWSVSMKYWLEFSSAVMCTFCDMKYYEANSKSGLIEFCNSIKSALLLVTLCQMTALRFPRNRKLDRSYKEIALSTFLTMRRSFKRLHCSWKRKVKLSYSEG